MSTIISILFTYNQLLLSQINQLLIFIAKNIPLNDPKYDMTSPKYKKLTVDKLPIIKTLEKLDYNQLLNEFRVTHGKDKRPVNSRGKNPVSPDTVCPQCGAPHIYISTIMLADVDSFGAKFMICISTKTRLILKLRPSFAHFVDTL